MGERLADLLELILELLRLLTGTGKRRYYLPYRATVWHPIYHDSFLTTEQRRADREAMLPDEWSPAVWSASKKFWGNRCAACRSQDDLQRDHIIPVASVHCPGAIPSNLIPLCKTCNTRKSAEDLAVWYREDHGDPEKLVNKVWDWQFYCFERGWR